MADKNTQKIGWIGMGRMGYPMAERLLKAGYDVSIWNRTRSKAEPLAQVGGKVVDKLSRPRRLRRGVLDRRRPARTSSRSISARTASCTGRQACRRRSSTARPSRWRNPPTIRDAAEGARRRLRRRAGLAATPRSSRPASCRRSCSGPEAALQDGRAADRGRSRRRACPMSARANSRASARSRTTSCSAW